MDKKRSLKLGEVLLEWKKIRAIKKENRKDFLVVCNY